MVPGAHIDSTQVIQWDEGHGIRIGKAQGCRVHVPGKGLSCKFVGHEVDPLFEIVDIEAQHRSPAVNRSLCQLRQAIGLCEGLPYQTQPYEGQYRRCQCHGSSLH